jgi:lysyl-tRNA synthetase class 1
MTIPNTPYGIDPDEIAVAHACRAWPFEEARRLIARLDRLKRDPDVPVLFETGYGPSGLPHIGTFGEVARTSMVRHAFEVLTEGRRKTRLVCFSTTWTVCGRCRATYRTAICLRRTSKSR